MKANHQTKYILYKGTKIGDRTYFSWGIMQQGERNGSASLVCQDKVKWNGAPLRLITNIHSTLNGNWYLSVIAWLGEFSVFLRRHVYYLDSEIAQYKVVIIIASVF